MWADQRMLTERTSSRACSPHPSRGSPAAGSARGHERDRFDLDARVGDEAGYLHGRAARRCAREGVAARDVVVGVELGTGDEAGDLDDVLHLRAGVLDGLAHAREALLGLGGECLVDHRAVVERAALPGDVDPAPRPIEADRLAEGRSVRALYALLVHFALPLVAVC